MIENADSHGPNWIELTEKWCHYQHRQFSKGKLSSFTLSCSSSCIKHCFPANKMRHNFLHAVCGDSVISLAGRVFEPGSNRPGAAESLLSGTLTLKFCIYFFGFLFFPGKILSNSPPSLSFYLFLFLSALDLFCSPAISGDSKQKETHFWEEAVNSLTEGEANVTFLNKAAGSIAVHPAGSLGQSRLVSKRARTELVRFAFFFSSSLSFWEILAESTQ